MHPTGAREDDHYRCRCHRSGARFSLEQAGGTGFFIFILLLKYKIFLVYIFIFAQVTAVEFLGHVGGMGIDADIR
jgi:hypothetical protein